MPCGDYGGCNSSLTDKAGCCFFSTLQALSTPETVVGSIGVEYGIISSTERQIQALNDALKSDMKEFKTEMKHNNEFKTEMGSHNKELKAEMKDFKTEMKSHNKELKGEMKEQTSKFDLLLITITAQKKL